MTNQAHTDAQALAEKYAAFERGVITDRDQFLTLLRASRDTFNSDNLARRGEQLSELGLKTQVLADKRGKGIVGSSPNPEDWNFPIFFVPGRNIRTVADLIARLQALPPDTGLEDGFADPFYRS